MTYTPQYLWILMGPVIGAFAGGIVGAVVMLTSFISDSGSGSVWGSVAGLVAVGLATGGFCGAVAGFFACWPFIFLVSRHLARPVARRRAFALGVLVPPFAMLVMISIVFGDPSLLTHGLPSGDDWKNLAPLLVSSVLGGPLAAWAAGRDALPKPVS